MNAQIDTPHLSSNDLAVFYKACGDDLRLQILRVLRHDSLGVLELCHIFDIKQSSMSHHLKVLTKAGLLESRREGNTIFYRRRLSATQTVLNHSQTVLWETIDQISLCQATVERVNEVQAARAAMSVRFFQENANKFHQQQELIVDYQLYASAAEDYLDQIAAQNTQQALEIGPGEGAFLPPLAERFDNVVALDNSPAMLSLAQQRNKAQSYTNLGKVEFICGDTQAILHRQFDCVVINMVLHHVPSPQQIIQDAFRITKPGGHLIISEVCQHDQAWTRDACGDVWLGFDPDQLLNWTRSVGYATEASTYLAQRNGFRTQVHLLHKAVLDEPTYNPTEPLVASSIK